MVGLMADGSIAIGVTLRQRDRQYGSFNSCADVSQKIKAAMRLGHNWGYLDGDMREALEMIATKVARILNGNADIPDHWHDIAGYARLVEERLVREAGEAEVDPDEVD